MVAIACLLVPHVTWPCRVPHWRTQVATLTFCSSNSERCQQSTQSRYGIDSLLQDTARVANHGLLVGSESIGSHQPSLWLCNGQVSEIQQFLTCLSPFLSLSLSDETTRFLAGSAVGRSGYLWCLCLDKFKLRGSDRLPRQVSCSFLLDLRGDSRLYFFFLFCFFLIF